MNSLDVCIVLTSMTAVIPRIFFCIPGPSGPQWPVGDKCEKGDQGSKGDKEKKPLDLQVLQNQKGSFFV